MSKHEVDRRTFLRTSSAASLLAASAPLVIATQNSSESEAASAAATGLPPSPSAITSADAFAIPSCSWHRPLGSLPKLEMHPDHIKETGDLVGLNTATRTKKGIPLGGIGAGNFMYNLCGSFGPFQLKTGRYEERFLAQAAFHLREEIPGSPSLSRTLATDDVLPAWPRLNPGDGEYHALFPKGWCTYKKFSSHVTLQFFSPVIKDNYCETSYPVALFLFHLHNPSATRAKLSLMFTFPNAPYTGPQNTPMAREQSADSSKSFRDRLGLSNRYQSLPNNAAAILMSAHDPSNSPETENSQWCIATSHPATYVPVWDGDSDGSSIFQPFAANGALPNRDIASSSKTPCGALCVSLELDPGASVVVPFALAWYFPQIEFAPGTRWARRFTEWFPPASPDPSLHIAQQALANRDSWLAQVDAWQRPILTNPNVPSWVKQGTLNELYYSTFGGSFWENGCLSKPKRFGNRPGQHIAFVMECSGIFLRRILRRSPPSRTQQSRSLAAKRTRPPPPLLRFCDGFPRRQLPPRRRQRARRSAVPLRRLRPLLQPDSHGHQGPHHHSLVRTLSQIHPAVLHLLAQNQRHRFPQSGLARHGSHLSLPDDHRHQWRRPLRNEKFRIQGQQILQRGSLDWCS